MDAEDMKDMDAEDDENDPGQNEGDLYSNLDPKTIERVKEVFQMFDKDNQGFIEMDSLGTLLRWLKFNPTETEMTQYIEKYDQQRRN